MKKIKPILFIIFVLTFNQNILSQSAILTSGANANNQTIKLSFSVGQIFYQEFHSSDFYIIEGVQQPYEISLVLSTLNFSPQIISIDLFPNPSNNYTNLKIDHPMFFVFSYKLFDVNGKVLIKGNISNIITQIDLTEISPSTYFLKVFYNQIHIKTFKIIRITN